MKIAIVLGFFDPVLVRLQKEYSARLHDQSVVWIGTIRPHGDADLHNFKELLFDRLATGPTEVLVLAAVKRGKEETIGHAINTTCMFGRDRHTNVAMTQEHFTYALDDDGVVDKLNAFFGVLPVVEIFPGPQRSGERRPMRVG
jgi:hypothetical protein